MKALQQIIRRVTENPSCPWALATLVQTKASTYRKTGARLLVDAEGSTLGVLSGGCLEEEIGRYGRRVINDASAVLLSFDRSEERRVGKECRARCSPKHLRKKEKELIRRR